MYVLLRRMRASLYVCLYVCVCMCTFMSMQGTTNWRDIMTGGLWYMCMWPWCMYFTVCMYVLCHMMYVYMCAISCRIESRHQWAVGLHGHTRSHNRIHNEFHCESIFAAWVNTLQLFGKLYNYPAAGVENCAKRSRRHPFYRSQWAAAASSASRMKKEKIWQNAICKPDMGENTQWSQSHLI
jgi:hypothetical protein